jgi:heat shock protein HslJ
MRKQQMNIHSQKGLLTIVILIIGALALAAWAPLSAKGGESEEVAFELDGSKWSLISLGGESLVPGSEITAEFSEGQMAGSAGVNGYFAGYESEGETLTLGPAGSTMMMGPEKLMKQEMAYLAALGTAESYRVDGDTLEIVYGEGSLIFTAGE